MLYSIDKHILSGPGVQTSLCSGKDSGAFASGQPDTLVLHFTAGGSLASAVKTLASPDVKASAHLVVGRSGEIVQMVAFDRIAWHAGVSSWNGRTNLNRFSIGIEIDNAGRLSPSGDGFVSWFGRRYERAEALEAVHRNEKAASFWHVYTEEQIEACFQLCATLVEAYGIKNIVGHEEIAPGRKTDPGPAFPLDRLREQLLVGRKEDVRNPLIPAPAQAVVQGIVSTNLLNVRKQPHKSADLAGEPLGRGTSVEILETSGDWCRVKIERQGWVAKDYLKIS